MSRILFYQQAKLDMPDYLAVDGVQQGERADVSGYMAQLMEVADQAIRQKRPWVGRVGDYYFVKGYLAQRDELGRKMSFMYLLAAEEQAKENLLSYLEQDLSRDGKSISDETKASCIAIQNGENFPIWMSVIAVALIAVIFYLIIKVLS